MFFRSFLRFYGTNAYWLQMISDEDLDLTLHDIAKANFTVVRTWAFNDVTQKPSSGTYLQVRILKISITHTTHQFRHLDSEQWICYNKQRSGWLAAFR
jgi:acyl-CoA thioesterase